MSAVSPTAPNATEQVAYESRVRARYGIIAFTAALLLVIATLVELSGPHTPQNLSEATLALLTDSHRIARNLIGIGIEALSFVALATTLNWLFSISRARNPEVSPVWRWLVVVGAVLAIIATIVYQVILNLAAHTFARTGAQTWLQAHHLTNGAAFSLLPLLSGLGTLLLTFGFIWVVLNAMRVGLLHRPMGYLGMLAGVLTLFALGGGAVTTIVQAVWLGALSLLFLNRLPADVPPAWASGTSVPWEPMGAQGAGGGAGNARPTRTRQPRGGRRVRVSDLPALDPEPGVEPNDTAAATQTPPAAAGDAAGNRTRSSTPKRKRKRRN